MTGTGTSSEAAVAYERPRAWLWTQMLLDSAAWIVAVLLGLFLRYEMDYGLVHVPGLIAVVVLAVVAQMIAGALFGLYRGRYSFGSFDEAKALILVTLVVTIVGMPWAWWIMSVAGGGGMLVAAIISAVMRTKRGA